jgi:hypothetical protein
MQSMLLAGAPFLRRAAYASLCLLLKRYYITAMVNIRQEKFAQNLVAQGMNATAAYKAAGYTAKKDVTARNGAHELLTNPYVAARISELQRLAAKRHAKTVDTIISDLDQLRDLAIKNGQPAAGVAAVMGAARILGFVPIVSR